MGAYEKIVVLSDIHFGSALNEASNEKTDLEALKTLLNLIIELKPKKVILLGDILDLWRVEFLYAWAEAEKIQFFSTLTKYVDLSKGNAKVIYVIGNHDHILQELSLNLHLIDKYQHLMNKSEITSNENFTIESLPSEKLDQKIENLHHFFKNVDLYYPHYSEEIQNVGTVYFDHGHYAVEIEGLLKRTLAWIYRRLTFILSVKKQIKENAKFPELFSDKEANISALYSVNFYSKFDDLVNETRLLIWRFIKMVESHKKWLLAIPIAIDILLIFTKSLPSPISLKAIALISIHSLIPFARGKDYGVLKRAGVFLRAYNLATGKSDARGNEVENVRKKITEDEFSIERKKKNEEYDGADRKKRNSDLVKFSVALAALVIVLSISYTRGIEWTRANRKMVGPHNIAK
jgi:predicted phosphodiesterase